MNTRYDFCPRVFWSEATTDEQQAQLAHQAALAATGRARFGERCYVSPAAGFVPDDVTLGDGSYLAGFAYATGEITARRRCTFNPYAVVRGTVRMGDGVRIGAHASILGFNHCHEGLDRPIHEQGIVSRGINIGADVWIGSGSIILDGVTVGSHSIIGAGAVVRQTGCRILCAVAIDEKTVLVASLFNLSGWKSPVPQRISIDPNRHMTAGDWVELKKDQPVDLDVIIGERPGGTFGAFLLYEKQGVTYPVNERNEPMLPVFQLVRREMPLLPVLKRPRFPSRRSLGGATSEGQSGDRSR